MNSLKFVKYVPESVVWYQLCFLSNNERDLLLHKSFIYAPRATDLSDFTTEIHYSIQLLKLKTLVYRIRQG